MNKTWSNEQLAILDREYPTADLKELASLWVRRKVLLGQRLNVVD
jgi:hypothetical protein